MTEKLFRPEQARVIADAFERHGVDYLFIGKGGAILLGYPGATQDVDLFPRKSKDNGLRIVAALTEIGFILSETDRAEIVEGKDFVQISAGPFDVDLVFAPDGIENYDAAAKNAVRVENFPVMSIADIIASKRAAGRKRALRNSTCWKSSEKRTRQSGRVEPESGRSTRRAASREKQKGRFLPLHSGGCRQNRWGG